MFTVILTFLKTHWQTSLIAAAILTVLATLSVQHLEIHHLRNELSACHAEGVVLEDSNRRLVASIGSQNDAITALKAQGVARANAAGHALTAAKQRAGQYAIAAGRIESQASSLDGCADLRKLIEASAGGRK